LKPLARQTRRAEKPRDRPPLSLDRRRVYIFPTGHGFLFLLVLLAMLLGAVNYNNNLAFLLVFLLGGIMLAGLFHTYRNLYGLTINNISARPVFAGKEARFDLVIDSGSRSRRGICFFIEKARLVTADFSAGQTTSVSVALPSRTRGYLRPERLTIFSRYPLGLLRAWTVLRPAAACLVYPAPRAGARRAGTGDQPAAEGEAGGLTRPGAEDFAGLMPYQPGQPVRQIAWKALSRGQGVFIKQFLTGSGGAIFDYDAVPGDDPEERLSRLCHLVVTAGAMNLTYGLRLPDQTIAPASGRDHQHRCLKQLALFGREETAA